MSRCPVLLDREPTGKPSMPLVLLEGEEKSGKTWAAALLTRSEKIGRAWFLDLGEGSSDDYINIPGTRYKLLRHDGTFAAIYEQVLAVKAEAAKDRAEGKPPVLLVIDTMTDLWNGLKAWTDERHRRSKLGRKQYADDPDGEHKPSQNLWNDTNSRHRRLMTQLMTFPGIVVMTARGKEVSEVRNGKPVEGGAKVWSVTAQQDVPYDATLWVRMFRERPPVVVGCRSVVAPVRPGSPPQAISYDGDNLLEWLIFDVLRIDPKVAEVRPLQHTSGGDLTEDEMPAVDDDADRNEATRPGPRQWPAPVKPQPSRLAAFLADAARADDVGAIAMLRARCTDEQLATDATADLNPEARAITDTAGLTTPGEPVTVGHWLDACEDFLDREGGMTVFAALAAERDARARSEAGRAAA